MGNCFDENFVEKPRDVSAGPVACHQHLQNMRDDIYSYPPAAPAPLIDLGFFKFGIEDGSLKLGVGLPGIAGAEGSIGHDTGVRAGADLGPLGNAHGGAGARIDRDGIHAGAGGGAEALGLVGGGAGVRADAGAYAGVRGNAGGFAGPVDARVGAHTYADPYGAEVAAKAKVRVQGLDY